MLYGTMPPKELAIGAKGKKVRALFNGMGVRAEVEDGSVRFAHELKLKAGDGIVVG